VDGLSRLNGWHRVQDVLGGVVRFDNPDAFVTLSTATDRDLDRLMLDKSIDNGPRGRPPLSPTEVPCVVDIADVVGAYLSSEQRTLNMETSRGQIIKMAISSLGAMRLLVFLGLAQQRTGRVRRWAIGAHPALPEYC